MTPEAEKALAHPFDGPGDYCYFPVPCEPYQDSFGTRCDRKYCGQLKSAHLQLQPEAEKALRVLAEQVWADTEQSESRERGVAIIVAALEKLQAEARREVAAVWEAAPEAEKALAGLPTAKELAAEIKSKSHMKTDDLLRCSCGSTLMCSAYAEASKIDVAEQARREKAVEIAKLKAELELDHEAHRRQGRREEAAKWRALIDKIVPPISALTGFKAGVRWTCDEILRRQTG